MTQGASSSASPPSSSSPCEYDVFLSYRVKDTGNTFISHLYKALAEKPTNTFLDRKNLKPGKNIFSQLMKAIEGCQIAIPVISENYASSIWCYIELVKIFHCQKERKKNGEDLQILPIFYNVEPSDVGKQKNKDAEEFESPKEKLVDELETVEKSWEPLREEMEKVDSWVSWEDLTEKMGEVKWDHREQFIKKMEKMKFWQRAMVMADNNLWKTALQQVADLQGGSKIDSKTMIEADCITEFVKQVPKAVDKTPPFHIDKPVGLEAHVEDIRVKLNLGSEEILFLGIVGSGGMGKTTIAKAVYNEIYQSFKGNCSFLDMVEEKPDFSREMKSLVALQNQLVLDVSKKKNTIEEVNNGIRTIKKHLQSKKVLIVVDNVERETQLQYLVGARDWFTQLQYLVGARDWFTQLQYLVGARDWFGKGSRIIITTRMENLLPELKEEKIHRVQKMNEKDSVQLLSLYVFNENRPHKGFQRVTNEVVRYAQHLPLALVVLGPLLRGKTPQDWKSLLQEWKETANQSLMAVLETSFKELNEVDRAIFLDISCFFVGQEKFEVIAILDARDQYKKSTDRRIRLLSQKSLLEINENRICMHDMIREMGRAIVYRESPLKLGERSRLWGQDAIDVWRNNTGTLKVEGFVIVFKSKDEEVVKSQSTMNTLLQMPNLRLLHISCEYQTKKNYSWNLAWEHHGQNSIFKNLVWVCLDGCSFEYIPNNFHMVNLVILHITSNDLLKQVWEKITIVGEGTTKRFPKLKDLCLWLISSLTCLSDLSSASNLEKLILSDCEDLVEVDESIGDLSKLVELEIDTCENLRGLPNSIGKLASLKKLVILDCEKIENFPNSICQLSKLETLTLAFMSFTTLPNLSNLKRLRELDLSNCTKLIKIKDLKGLESLEIIQLFGCENLTDFDDKRIFKVLSNDIGNRNICDLFISAQTSSSRMIATKVVGKVPYMKIEGVIIRLLFSDRHDWLRTRLRVVIDNQSKHSTWEHKASCDDDGVLKPLIWVIKIPYCVWEEKIAKSGDIIEVSVQDGIRNEGRVVGVHFYTLQERTSGYTKNLEPLRQAFEWDPSWP